MSDARALWAHTFGFQSDHDAKAAFGAGFLRLELISVRPFVLSGAPERIKHLASVPGGLVEREPALGRRVNLDATINVFERLAASRQRPRVVFASSVAVYGDMDGRARSVRTVRRARRSPMARTSAWPRSRSPTSRAGATFLGSPFASRA